MRLNNQARRCLQQVIVGRTAHRINTFPTFSTCHSHTRHFSRNVAFQSDAALVPTSLDSAQIAKRLEQVQIESSEYSPSKGIFPYRVLGNETTVVEIDLQPGEAVRAETGSLVYMDQPIAIDTSTGGGIGQGLKRLMTGENFFISDFVNNGEVVSKVCLSTAYPSKIIPVKLEEHGGSLVCQKGAFLAGSTSTQFEMYSQHTLGAGFFGGSGFILQELTGDGMILLRAGGSLILKELQEGETIKTSAGTLVAFERSVTFGIERLPGVKNMIFGGEGIFLPTLTGPGKVWLQGLPFNRLVDSIAGSIKTGGYGALGGFGAGSTGSSSGSGAEEGEEGEEGAEGEEGEAVEEGEESYEDSFETTNEDNWAQNTEEESSGGGFFSGISSWFGNDDEDD